MFRLLKIPCFLITAPYTHLHVKAFYVYFELTWNQKIQNFYKRHIL